MNRIHIIGRKNSGKTTLIVELVTQLRQRGLRVATIKHTHHDHELDTPGKDSFKHREAGAVAVGILSSTMNAIFWPASETKQTDEYSAFDAMLDDCDLVLVEGDQRAAAPRIEVWRSVSGEPPIAASEQSILAVVTDDAVGLDVKVWPRSDVDALVDQIIELSSQ